MFSVDRIENDVVILQDIKSGEIRQVNVNEFDFKIKEKDVFIYDGVKYILNNDAKKERLRLLREKMDSLKK